MCGVFFFQFWIYLHKPQNTQKDLDKTLFSKPERSLICVIRSITSKLTQYMKSFRLKRKKVSITQTYF